MFKFVEFHENETGARVAIDVFSILNVYEYEDATGVILKSSNLPCKDSISNEFVVSESYDEVIRQLREATAYQNI